MTLAKAVELKVVLKRGPRRSETKNKIMVSPESKVARFEETLSVLATLYKDIKKNKFQEKTATISIHAYLGKKDKLIGTLKINIADYVNQSEAKNVILKINKCPDKNATIEVAIKSIWIKEMGPDEDTFSQMSEMKSVESVDDSDFFGLKRSDSIDIPIDENDINVDRNDHKVEEMKVRRIKYGAENAMSMYNIEPPNLNPTVQRETPVIPRQKIRAAASFAVSDGNDGKNQKLNPYNIDKLGGGLAPIREKRFLYSESMQLPSAKSDTRKNTDESGGSGGGDLSSRRKLDFVEKIAINSENVKEQSHLKERINELEKENKKLKDENMHVSQEYQRKLKEAFKQREDSSNKIEELERNVLDLEIERDRLKSDNNKVKNAYIKAKALADEFKNNLEENEGKLKTLDQQTKNNEEEILITSSIKDTELEMLKEKLYKEIDELRLTIRNKNNEILSQKEEINKLEEELDKAQASHNEHVLDEDSQYMNQIKYLQEELVLSKTESEECVGKVMEENKELKKNLDSYSRDIKKNNASKEKEVAKINIENDFLKQQIEEYQSRVRELEHESLQRKNSLDNSTPSETKGLKDMISRLREDNMEQKERLKDLDVKCTSLESQLVTAKMSWANVELEKENILHKLKEKNEQLKKFSTKVTKLELDLVKSKQDLGEALNAIMEYECETRTGFVDVDKNMSFKEKSPVKSKRK